MMNQIRVEDVRQSSIFWSLGHFYEYTLYQLANLFRVPFGLFSQELNRLGYSDYEIHLLEENDHPEGFCRKCHADIWPSWNESSYCPKCEQIGVQFAQYIKSDIIPTTNELYLYDVQNNKIIRN